MTTKETIIRESLEDFVNMFADTLGLDEPFNNVYVKLHIKPALEQWLTSTLHKVYDAGQENGSCHCKDVDFGTYKNVVSMKTPEGEWVCIDTCIATEIGYLWHQGVKTLNSCCGHGKLEPSVVVDEESIGKMHELGYRNTKERCANPEATFILRQCFTPPNTN